MSPRAQLDFEENHVLKSLLNENISVYNLDSSHFAIFVTIEFKIPPM